VSTRTAPSFLDRYGIATTTPTPREGDANANAGVGADAGAGADAAATGDDEGVGPIPRPPLTLETETPAVQSHTHAQKLGQVRPLTPRKAPPRYSVASQYFSEAGHGPSREDTRRWSPWYCLLVRFGYIAWLYCLIGSVPWEFFTFRLRCVLLLRSYGHWADSIPSLVSILSRLGSCSSYFLKSVSYKVSWTELLIS
jgi:hypothetical protein